MSEILENKPELNKKLGSSPGEKIDTIKDVKSENSEVLPGFTNNLGDNNSDEQKITNSNSSLTENDPLFTTSSYNNYAFTNADDDGGFDVGDLISFVPDVINNFTDDNSNYQYRLTTSDSCYQCDGDVYYYDEWDFDDFLELEATNRVNIDIDANFNFLVFVFSDTGNIKGKYENTDISNLNIGRNDYFTIESLNPGETGGYNVDVTF